MTLEEAYDILERYYLTVYDTYQDSNLIDFDVEDILTKACLERILLRKYNLTSSDIVFLKSLLSDGDVGESVESAIKVIVADFE